MLQNISIQKKICNSRYLYKNSSDNLGYHCCFLLQLVNLFIIDYTAFLRFLL